MLINYHNRLNLKSAYYAPSFEKSAPLDKKNTSPESTGKPDYSKYPDRNKLYKRAENFIKTLRQSPDKNRWKIAKELEKDLNVCLKNELGKISPQVSADYLHSRLDSILHPVQLSSEDIQLRKHMETQLELAKKLNKAKAITSPDLISSPKLTVRSAKAKKEISPAPAKVSSTTPSLGKELQEYFQKLSVSPIDTPRVRFSTKTIALDDVPNAVREVAKKYLSNTFTGEQFFGTTDGKIWKVTVKPIDDNIVTKWESVQFSA